MKAHLVEFDAQWVGSFWPVQHQAAAVDLQAVEQQVPRNPAEWSRQVRRYQDQNPYYHYYHALAAYNNGDLETAEELSEALEHLLVSQGKVVSRKQVASAVTALFHDRRKLKDEQILAAKQNAAASPARTE